MSSLGRGRLPHGSRWALFHLVRWFSRGPVWHHLLGVLLLVAVVLLVVLAVRSGGRGRR